MNPPISSDNRVPAKEPHGDCPYWADRKVISSELKRNESERKEDAADRRQLREDFAALRSDVARLVVSVAETSATVAETSKLVHEMDVRERTRSDESRTIAAAIETQRLANEKESRALRVKLWLGLITVLGALAGTIYATSFG